MKYVIAGGSIAAATAYNEIKKYEKDADVKVVSKEKFQPYGKMLLPYVLSDSLVKNSMFAGKIDENDLILNDPVIDVDTQNKSVKALSGRIFSYDKLLISTGADSYLPDIDGIDNSRVAAVRYLSDIEKIERLIASSDERKAVIIGAGLVSTEMGYALSELGLSIDFVVHSNKILSQILDQYAADMVEKRIMQNYPVKFFKGENVLSIEENKNKVYVKLESGKVLEGCCVIVGRGVVPNVDMLRNTNIAINKGVAADKHLKTNIDDVYTAGDVAETEDAVFLDKRIHAIWPAAVEQAKIAAKNMLGLNIEYKPEFSHNLVPIFGMDIFSGGIGKEDKFDVYTIKRDNEYRKIILESGVLKGFIILGEVENYGAYTHFAREKIDVSSIKDDLLFGTASFNFPQRMKHAI